MRVENPILAGFHPDPSLIRVGNEYYIASSTFEWYPGVRLHRSADLKHWIPVPGALRTRDLLDMRGVPSSAGIWAPDLSYADGRFWLVFTVVRQPNNPFKDVTNYLTWSDSIEGPWASPIRLNGVGFDPSLFHDDDGRKYLVQQTWDHREWHHAFNGITLTELDNATFKPKKNTARIIWRGDDTGYIEGPHLYKINGRYYLFVAQGGTGYSHQEAVARSETLSELSFEGMPDNPLITNIDTPRFGLQKQGHGSLTNTPDGRWYYASLCARPWHHPEESRIDPRGWSSLGRETSLQEIIWDEDGWPKVVGGRAGRLVIDVPDAHCAFSDGTAVPEECDCSLSTSRLRHQHDDFESEVLDNEWNTLRVPFDEGMGQVGSGRLILRGQGSLRDTFELSLVARRWQAYCFNAQTKIKFVPDAYQAMAGLTNYYNDQCWSWAYITYDEKRKCRVIDVAQCDHGVSRTFLRDQAVEIPDDAEWVWLRTRVRCHCYEYDYSFDGASWKTLPVTLDAKLLTDEYAPTGSCGFFTGAFVGMAAVDYSGYEEPAVFDHFDYRELDAD